VDPTLLKSLVNSGYIPVVATVATDEKGQGLNVNADTAAGEVGETDACQHSIWHMWMLRCGGQAAHGQAQPYRSCCAPPCSLDRSQCLATKLAIGCAD